ncbi:peroxiredoxin [Acaryochloris sp. CCMEE 5410]|uniref:peroxiredoxin n=1 Tax=Acaryochloris sp. CCMEE 5410 TaxID=310037 RepID=UPI0002484A10|nr:peroxiredoxin [Acaryochloris sp. CCMEE 5410]KAI9132131.1 peroxiredoxin [Acaryochloris sp. CCMEE 5410]
MAIKVGNSVPDVTLQTPTGETVSLKSFLGEKIVVLYFYPKDDTPGCTKEACGFRDSYTVFQDAGAEVIGVSNDTPNSHQQFANKYQLPFTLLSDGANQARKAFGVPSTLGLLPGRVTYVIDTDGVVRHIFNSQLNFQGHIDESLKIVQSLTKDA